MFFFVVIMYNRSKFQCHAPDKAYRAMQSLYANCMVKAETLDLATDSGCIHVNVEEKRRVQQLQTFDSSSSYITIIAVINSFKPI